MSTSLDLHVYENTNKQNTWRKTLICSIIQGCLSCSLIRHTASAFPCVKYDPTKAICLCKFV